MATRLQRATLHTPPDDEDERTESRALAQSFMDDEPEQTDTDRVAAMLRLAGESGKSSVKIYKLENGKEIFCDSLLPSEFEDGDFKLLRDSFGAGSFRIRLYGNNQAGHFGLLGRQDVTIAESRLPSNAQTAQPVVNNQLSAALEMIARSQAATLEALAGLKNAPAVDPMAQMTQMLSMMTAMREAMGLNNQPRQSQSSIGEIVAAVRELRNVASEINPQTSDSEPSLTSMLPQVLSLIQTGLQSNQNNAAQPTQMTPIAIPQSLSAAPGAAAPIQQPTPEPPTPENDMKAMEILKLRTNVAQLIALAKVNAPVEQGATIIYDNLPDELIEVLFMDNWFDVLTAAIPDFTPYRDWITRVRDAVLPMFDEPENTTANATINTQSGEVKN